MSSAPAGGETRPTVLPGFVNAHTHMYSALVPHGIPAPTPVPEDFLQILERLWWRLDRALDEPSLRASARLYVAEALLAGTTTLIDHHESPGVIEGSLDMLADACDELGIRALLCYGATERNAGREEAQLGLAESRRFALTNRRARVRGLIGVHASFTVSNETLDEAAALCRETDNVVHVHVAEDVVDLGDARERCFRGPLERMAERGALPAGSILAHGVHLDEEQVRWAAAQRLWLVQNPRSNQGNRVGYPRALWASDRVALGTDGYPADMRAERAALERAAAGHPECERGGTGRLGERLDAGRRLAAERFGSALEGDTVELEPGPAATVPVRRVTVDGHAVVEAGRLVHGNLGEIRAHAHEEARRLRQRMEVL
ncbi:MAG: amidohydrolase family protein [Candidatus Eisenbacteria bacterium]